ncbi:MAG: hypothetical protein COA99_12965 [Moraxellaceae bacterium]|nr:MAG: hypothetical protein COA99_12965 [Moraxellaceae bacterium]
MLLPSGSVSLAVGADKLERGSGSSTTSSSFQFSYSTAWSNSSLSLSATKELTDTVGRYDDPFFDEYRSLAVSGGFDVTNLETEEVTRIDSEEKFDALGFADSSFDIEDAVIRTTASTNYSTSLWSPLNQLVVGAAYTEDILQTLKDKQRVKSADIHLSRQTSENHTLYTRYNFQWTHFDSVSINRKDIFHSLSIGSDYELGQSLTLSGNLSGSLRRVGSDDGIISKALSISIAYEIH